MNRLTSLLVAAVLIGVAIVGANLLMPNSSKAPEVQITDSVAIATLVQIVTSGVATSENYIGQRVRLATGTLRNVSTDRVVKRIDLKIVWVGTDGKPIHESVETALASTQSPLQPGGESTYSVAFENLPRNWNYGKPDVTVVRVTY